MLLNCSSRRLFTFTVSFEALLQIEMSIFSCFWRELWKHLQTKIRLNFAYHPQMNNQTKVVNISLTNMIRFIANERFKQWDNYLSQAEFAFNLMVNKSIGRSSFNIVYIKSSNITIDITILPKFQSRPTTEMVNNFQTMLQEVKSKLVDSTQHYKSQANKSCHFKRFEIGDLVMVRLRKKRFPTGIYHKLKPPKIGPFSVIHHINNNAYILQLPPDLTFSSKFNIYDLYIYKPPDVDITHLSELKSSSI